MGKKDIKKTKKRFLLFTLVEVLIVLAIIALASAAIGLNVVKAIRQERFNTAVALARDKLQMAQDMMLIRHYDVKVVISKVENEDKALRFWIRIDGELDAGSKFTLNQEPIIKGLTSVEFYNLHEQQIEQLPVTLEYFAGGAMMSRGTLHLYGEDKNTLQEVIQLSGYPRALESKAIRQKLNSQDDYEEHNDGIYPKEIKKLLEEGTAIPPP